MPDNVKKVLVIALRRLLRPLVRLMLREGFTYSQFATIAQMAFVDCAAKDFGTSGRRTSGASISALTGIASDELRIVVSEQEKFELDANFGTVNPFARVLHGWHNDRDYVGPYGYPAEIPFSGVGLSLSALTLRHAPGVSPHVVLQELRRIGAVSEVGADIWKPLVQEYIEPTLSAENIQRMASLVESLLATVERNTRGRKEGNELFERTMVVDSPLTQEQLLALQSYLKVAGAQFLQRVDTFAAIDLQESMIPPPDAKADIRTGLQCFMYVEPEADDRRLRDLIDLD